MSTVRLRNVNPLGGVEVPMLGLVLTAGQEFDVDADVASLLLEQTGNYELATAAKPAKSTKETTEEEAV